MDTEIENAEQIGLALAHLARLRHCRDPHSEDALEGLRPRWLGLDAWDVVLEELENGCYREPPARPKCPVTRLPVRSDAPANLRARVVAIRF
ncbi:MAG: hypothetical protein EPN36_05710 [Rhodanobacteraceae bacterium]|nr:MAG: hypothetical protein EPN36_05710 [Rhodanobacteraceae bacterium]